MSKNAKRFSLSLVKCERVIFFGNRKNIGFNKLCKHILAQINHPKWPTTIPSTTTHYHSEKSIHDDILPLRQNRTTNYNHPLPLSKHKKRPTTTKEKLTMAHHHSPPPSNYAQPPLGPRKTTKRTTTTHYKQIIHKNLPRKISQTSINISLTIHSDPPPTRNISERHITANYHHQTIHKNPLQTRKISQWLKTTHSYQQTILQRKFQRPTTTWKNLTTSQNHLLLPSNHPHEPTSNLKNFTTTHSFLLPLNHPNNTLRPREILQRL